MRNFLLTLGVLLLVLAPLHAQGYGLGTSGNGSTNTLMVTTPKGLFTLRAGVLAKFELTTLNAVKMLQLFGPAPEQPKENTDWKEMQKYWAEMQKRSAPAIMFAKDNDLIIVIGDGFARINQETFKVEKSADLRPAETADPTADPATGGQPPRSMEPVPGYLLVDNTLFLMRGKEMLSINITKGEILKRSALPKELQPAQMNYRGGGGRNNPGGGTGGGGRNTSPTDTTKP